MLGFPAIPMDVLFKPYGTYYYRQIMNISQIDSKNKFEIISLYSNYSLHSSGVEAVEAVIALIPKNSVLNFFLGHTL